MMAAARSRIVAAVRDVASAREAIAITAVVSSLPSLIDEALKKSMGSADARIYSRAELRRFVSEFAIELILAQVSRLKGERR